jgi:hypothetical protein
MKFLIMLFSPISCYFIPLDNIRKLLKKDTHTYIYMYNVYIKLTMLQAGMSWVRFPMRSLDFSIYLMLLAALWPWVDSA